jgi:phage head maturation protease
LKRLRLIDVGPVSYPAYVDTSSALVVRTVGSVEEREKLRKQIDDEAKLWTL